MMIRRKRQLAEERFRVEGREAEDNLTKRGVKKWVTMTGLSLLGAMLVTARVLFFKYLAV